MNVNSVASALLIGSFKEQPIILSSPDLCPLSLEIHNLSIGQSEFELKPGKGTEIAISKVSAVSKGTIQYENGSWLWVLPSITVTGEDDTEREKDGTSVDQFMFRFLIYISVSFNVMLYFNQISWYVGYY